MTIHCLAVLPVLAGAGLAVVASIGLPRLPDLLIRAHAATELGALRAGLMTITVLLNLPDAGIGVRGVPIILFLLPIAPLAAHMQWRAALRTGAPLMENTRLEGEQAQWGSPEAAEPED